MGGRLFRGTATRIAREKGLPVPSGFDSMSNLLDRDAHLDERELELTRRAAGLEHSSQELALARRTLKQLECTVRERLIDEVDPKLAEKMRMVAELSRVVRAEIVSAGSFDPRKFNQTEVDELLGLLRIISDSFDLGTLEKLQAAVQTLRGLQTGLTQTTSDLNRQRDELQRQIEELRADLDFMDPGSDPPFYLRVVNHTDRPIVPIYNSVLMGRALLQGVDNETMLYLDRDQVAALRDRIGELYGTNQRPSEELFHSPHFMESLERCRQLLQFSHIHVSRLHAMLELRRGAVSSTLFLHSLGANQPSINGRILDAPGYLLNGVEIIDGMEISLAHFTDAPSFKIYKNPVYIKTLVIATDSHDKHMEYFIDGASRIEGALSKSGKPTASKRVLGRGATIAAVNEALSSMSNENPDALVIVVLYAHGSPSDFSLWDGHMSKLHFDELLEKIPARKICIVNSCHAAGVWGGKDLPAQFLLSSGKDELTYGSKYLDSVAGFIESNFRRGEPVDFKKLKVRFKDQTPFISPDGMTQVFGGRRDDD